MRLAGSRISLPKTERPALHLVVAALVIISVWVTTFVTVTNERANRLQQGMVRAQDLVAVYEAHALTIFGYADIYLSAARREYEHHGLAADLVALLNETPPDPSILSHISVIDAAGNTIFTSAGDAIDPGAYELDRDYFLLSESASVDLPLISLPSQDRKADVPTLRLVRRVEAQPGQFGGVVIASILIETLSDVFGAENLGKNGSVGLIGLDKKVRAWSVDGVVYPDLDLADSRLWAALERAPEGLVTDIDPVTGQDSELAYRRVAAYPLIATVGLDRSDILATMAAFTRSAISIALLATLVILLLTASILRDARLLGALQVEVAERRRAEAEAIRATEIKTAFLTTMSHEVRTPINAILGLFELIEQADIPERQKRQAQAGQTAATDLFKQLTNVLDASRLEAKSLDLTIRPEPLQPMLATLSQLLEAAISVSGKSIEGALRCQGDVPDSVAMDRRRVDQVVLNLIDNAVKFTDAGKIDVTVSVVPDGQTQHLRIAVSDTGVGISPQSLPHVFDRFSQLDAAITRRARGAGLGLSICKELAELMHGSLHATSIEGQGSTFALMLSIEN